MARRVSQVTTKNKTFPLNQNLTCATRGIYLGTCVICLEQYVAKLINKFSAKWAMPRSNLDKPDCKVDNNQTALLRHYSESHCIATKSPLYEANTITYKEQTGFHSRDTCEDKCCHKLYAKNNIQNMMLTHVK